MQYQITSDNMEVTESMKVLATKKMQKLERRWSEENSDNILVRIVLNSAPEETFLVKIEASIDGEVFYTEEAGYSLETALVDAVEELDRLYEKEQTKKNSKDWEARREDKTLTEEQLEEEAALDELYEELEELDEEDLE